MSHRSRDLISWWRHRLLGAMSLVLSASAAAQVPVDSQSSEELPATAIIEARIEDGLLSLQANVAPLAEVLRAIGKVGGFPVQIRGELDAPISASFTDQPVDRVLRELVDKHTLIVTREETDTNQLVELRVVENRNIAHNRVDEEPPGVATAPEETADEAPFDRETFREARLGVQRPTKDDILFELGELDQTTRAAAIPKVGSLQSREAIQVIKYVISSDDDITVRSRAVAVLTRLDSPAARGLLRDRALADDDATLRMQSLNALASSEGERAVNVLGRALRMDPELKVRMSAMRALGRVGGDWAKRLLQRAARDPEPRVRSAAEQLLASWPTKD